MNLTKMYLQKRNGRWGFRRPIPRELQPFITEGCRTEIVVSLRTKDSREASKRYAHVWQASERILEEAENRRKAASGRPTLVARDDTRRTSRLERKPLDRFSKQELSDIIQRWYPEAKQQAFATARYVFNLGSRDERQDELKVLERQLQSLERTSDVDNDLAVNTQIRLLVEAAGGQMPRLYDPAFSDTLDWLIEAVRVCLLSINTGCSTILRTGIIPIVEKPAQIVQQSMVASTEDVHQNTLNDLIEQFDSDPKNQDWEQKTRDEFNLVYELLREFVGGSTPVSGIQRKQIKEMRDVYTQMPLRATLYYEGKSVRDAVAAGKKDGRPVISRATFNKRMTLLSSLFRYAVREQLISSSPAEGLTLKEEKKEMGRNSFSVEQLNRIFSGKIFDQFLDDTALRLKPNPKLQQHDFWVPLIALFQGFRMGEILQLMTRDIGMREGIPCIHIREGEGQSVKTQSSIRTVPIHPTLIDMGFLDFVKAVRAANQTELFPEATKGKTYSNKSHNYSKRFNRYLEQIGVKTGPDQKFHSFRHTFKDGLATADVPTDVRRSLGGWTDDDSSLESKYGNRLMPHLLKHLSRLKYEGLNLDRFILKPSASA